MNFKFITLLKHVIELKQTQNKIRRVKTCVQESNVTYVALLKQWQRQISWQEIKTTPEHCTNFQE